MRFFLPLALAAIAQPAWTDGAAAAEEKLAQRGYRLLVEKPYLPPEFDQEVFDELWTVWETPLREKARQATPEERRRMAFSRYGLTERPGEEASEVSRAPLQYVVDAKGRWTVNCLACHGGKVAGRVIPGLPNSHYAMQTLADEVRQVKLTQGKITLKEVLGALFPLSRSNGTTNAVMFGVAVNAWRDADLNFDNSKPIPKFIHHDVDAPPWWNTKKKRWFYIDASAHADHRAMMQFLLSSPTNDGEKIRGWEEDFRAIFAWIQSLEPPNYPYEIDQTLAAEGQRAFERVCAECHGTYGKDGSYPERMVPIDEIGTDRVRYDALRTGEDYGYHASWLSYYGQTPEHTDRSGYVAPPLDGVWASAPYFHNGSVPTLWHVLRPAERPLLWLRSEDGYDSSRVGLEVAEFDSLPEEVTDPREKRRYFNTRLYGKDAGGHDYPNELTEAEKRAVLEYLKTL